MAEGKEEIAGHVANRAINREIAGITPREARGLRRGKEKRMAKEEKP